MALLDSIDGPADLRTLRPDQLPQLAQEIRDFLITSVTRTGGHLGPNLGVVELTIALHRVFDSPRDAVVWDTGHQAYVHKLLTGRKDFDRLRTKGGLSGYPSRSESPHDVVENSHASTALSWADGIAWRPTIPIKPKNCGGHPPTGSVIPASPIRRTPALNSVTCSATLATPDSIPPVSTCMLRKRNGMKRWNNIVSKIKLPLPRTRRLGRLNVLVLVENYLIFRTESLMSPEHC